MRYLVKVFERLVFGLARLKYTAYRMMYHLEANQEPRVTSSPWAPGLFGGVPDGMKFIICHTSYLWPRGAD